MDRDTCLFGAVIGVIFIILGYAGQKLWPSGEAVQLEQAPPHTHQWGQWGPPGYESRVNMIHLIQWRSCTNCGLSIYRTIERDRE